VSPLQVHRRYQKASRRIQTQQRMRLRLGERRALVIIGDFLMAWIALAIAIYFWANAESQQLGFFRFIELRLQPWFYLLPFLWLVLLVDSYDTRRTGDLRRTIVSIGVSTVIGAVFYLGIYFISDTSLPRRGVAMFLLAASLLTLCWRYIYIRVFTAPRFMHRILLIGAGVTGQAILKIFNKVHPQPFILAGVIDDDPEKIGTEVYGHRVLGGSELILETIEKENISELIVAISGRMNSDTFQTLLDAQESGVEITRMPRAYEELLGRVPVHYLEADWVLRSFVDEARIGPFYNFTKRLLDIIGGLVGVIILLVIGPIITLAVLIESGWPVVFQQTRAGKGGVPFKIYKFRTMYKDAEAGGRPQLALENDSRTTHVGRILRKTHLDEWLQFVNVLKGDMSLVGPRPERPEFVEHFQEQIPFYRARLLAKPGIAGWAQIHFDYAATMEEMVKKLEYDLYYIKHRSIWMDIVIVLRTFGTMIGLRGR
jgi:exopolysaccharide biosynthesis polyprenyl glycosylphosphotransferase